MHLSGAWQRKLSVLHISCLAIDEYRALEQILMVYFHTMNEYGALLEPVASLTIEP